MRSMTGYGTATGPVGKGRLFIEVKSVNHRFCEINCKMPPKMGSLEPLIRKYLQASFTRGKVDVYVKEKEPLFGGVRLSVNTSLAKEYQRNFRKLAHELHLPKEADFLKYLSLERFINVEEHEGSYEKFWRQVEKLIVKATAHAVLMQKREGAHLLRDQRRCIDTLAKLVQKIHAEITRVLRGQEGKVRKKLASSHSGPMDEQRLQMEVSLLGSRQDISEELTRLESHIAQYRQIVDGEETVGRKLDFLLQEMNREINTIGSKAADVVISRLVVESKTMLEKLREQVQNVE